ncbi:TPA: hypothetical protein ACJZSU_002077 [Pseudomonas aeruginosa]|nr:hypothetical protein [Stenotrophomonas maltophilia]HEL4243301.1 hypothetical protein [Stenotrophomonas maltophilia]
MVKLPGKTAYSGVRRPMTRESGFSSHPDSTGGEWKKESSKTLKLQAGETVEIVFTIPDHTPNTWIAFGGWYCADKCLAIEITSPNPKHTLSEPASPNWSKFGSMWQGDGKGVTATVSMTANKNASISLWNLACGLVEQPGCHTGGKFEVCTAPGYLSNLHLLSPEAHFWSTKGETGIALLGSTEVLELSDAGEHIFLKTCNRCARFLPINVNDERIQLSFSNHCVARRPCIHTGFGKLKNAETQEVLQLNYGYQLECRFCKKYCVNAAHNKNRTGAQMKEDGARRRHFELLVTELYQMSRQMAFKHRTGVELSDYIWKKFSCKCFNCNADLPTVKSMALDHTRPLALLWPLDETATALCGSCNSSKSDRYPREFYSDDQLVRLSALTGIPVDQLNEPTPNVEVITELVKRLDWLFDTFLMRAEMIRVRDGKITGELVVKALQKAFDAAPGGAPVDLVAEYELRRQKKS